ITAITQLQCRMRVSKFIRLEENVVYYYRQLCRKTDLSLEITIDPSTFDVDLKAANGAPIARDQLSAGEKQIFAIALLWALARTSGRALPIVIDTPLARLDRDHRRALVEQYFPIVSHQVIVLS